MKSKNKDLVLKEFKNKEFSQTYLTSFLKSLGYEDIQLSSTETVNYMRILMKENGEPRTLFVGLNRKGLVHHVALYEGEVDKYTSKSLGWGILLVIIIILVVAWYLLTKY